MVSRSTAPVNTNISASLFAPSTLHTDRLVLRRPYASDAVDVFARYAGDPEVTRFLGWRTHMSVAETQQFLAYCDTEWRQSGVGPYLIHLRENGELLGSASIRLVSSQQAAAGYILARDAWGHGYATEALHAVRGLALRLGVVKLTAMCHPEHYASLRVMQKCGFIREGLLRGYTQFPNLAPGIAADVLSYSFVFDTDWQPLVI